MAKKVGIPIMYTIRPLKEIYINDDIDTEERIYAYIVSECYVYRKIEQYYNDKEPKLRYKIGYKYNFDGSLIESDEAFFDSFMSEYVFCDIKEAKEFCKEKNDKLIEMLNIDIEYKYKTGKITIEELKESKLNISFNIEEALEIEKRNLNLSKENTIELKYKPI